MKVLFLGCHCDDIELGCAATIHKHKEDWDIYCSILSRLGQRNGEFVAIETISQKSLTSLGVSRNNIDFGDFPANNFHLRRDEIWHYLQRQRVKINPDVVVTQIADEHQDHVTLYQESVRVFREGTLLSYLSSLRSLRSFEPDTLELVNDDDVTAKLNSLEPYRNFYPDKNYLEKDNILALLRTNGIYVKAKYAESYKTINRLGIS